MQKMCMSSFSLAGNRGAGGKWKGGKKKKKKKEEEKKRKKWEEEETKIGNHLGLTVKLNHFAFPID